MKVFSFAALLLLLAGASAFSTQSLAIVRTDAVSMNAYVPDGFTETSYKKFKDDEAKKKKANLGGLGPRGFQSRSMQSFQEALERGEAAHLMPVFNARDRIKKGEIRAEDVPYMQRGGNWDNTDINGAKNKKRWLKSDKDYSEGGFRKEQSTSIFGVGEGLDWTGKRGRTGPESVPGTAAKFARNYKAPNIKSMKAAADKAKAAAPKKKMFGLF